MDAKRARRWAWLLGITILLATLLVACGGAAPLSLPVDSPVTVVAPDTESAPATQSPESTDVQGDIRLEFAQGTEAAYLVNEQLARLDLPNDAIGTTDAVSGVILLRPGNLIDAEGSELRVDLRTLTSDSDRRDRYVRRNTMSTSVHPFAVFVPRELPGLPSPLPSQGQASFQITGDMTMHGVTSELVWDVTAEFTGDEITGRATTEFPFAKFYMTRPKVRLVLNVEDRIRLRIDFRLVNVTG